MYRSIFAQVISMLTTLVIAYGLDRWLYYQQRLARVNSDFTRVFIWQILFGLVVCAVWLAFSWIVLGKSRPTLAISVIFIVIGLLAYTWYWLQPVLPLIGINVYLFKAPVVNLQYSGVFIAVMGMLTLLRRSYQERSG